MSILPSLPVKLGSLRLSCLTASKRRISSVGRFNYAKVSLEEKLGIEPKPKKPLSPFFKFIVETRPNMVKENPKRPVTEITKLISEKWRLADQTTKDRLQEQYKIEMLKYQDQYKVYENNLSPSDKEKILQAKLDIKIEKNKRLIKKKKSDLGCPKKPPSSYVIFALERASERGTLPFKVWQTKVSKMWEELPDSVKQKYIDKYKTEMEAYKKKFATWEQEMKVKGNVDVRESETDLKAIDIAQEEVIEREMDKQEDRIVTDSDIVNKIKLISLYTLSMIVFYLIYIQL